MNKVILKLLMLVIVTAVCVNIKAQSSCDKLYSNGVKLQQTMTVAAQKSAIAAFEKARACYDSQSKKDLCNQQIKSCRNIIAQLTRNKKPAARKKKDTPVDTVAVQVEKPEPEVTLSIDTPYVKFAGKGGDFQKVKVTCSSPDWEVREIPSWLNCSKNNDEIVIVAQKNPSKKEERSCNLNIVCGNKSIQLIVIQEKAKGLGVFGM